MPVQNRDYIGYCILLLLLLLPVFGFAQWNGYAHRRPIIGAEKGWYSIPLPPQLYGRCQPQLGDLRILGITQAGDSLEMPYLLKSSAAALSSRELPFKLLNQTQQANRYFYTFALDGAQPLNEIALAFDNPNFDWQVQLEGSHNQQEWFTILKDYRIVSVQNAFTRYRFTTLRFPSIQYPYLRLQIPSQEAPRLLPVRLNHIEQTAGRLQAYTSKLRVNEQPKEQQTTLEVSLPMPLPVSQLRIRVKDSLDYYRPLLIQYLADSTKTPNGWHYHYQTLYSGTLSSLEKAEFDFASTLAKQLRIVMSHGHNLPLALAGIEVLGPAHALTARLGVAAQYYLMYGNAQAPTAQYDIALFTEKIPPNLKALHLGPEENLLQNLPASSPLFSNKLWLWAIMVVVIGLMAWFSLNMLKHS